MFVKLNQIQILFLGTSDYNNFMLSSNLITVKLNIFVSVQKLVLKY